MLSFIILILTISNIQSSHAQDNKWENVIPYKINNNITYPSDIIDAINYYHQVTNVRFVERTNEEDYLEFASLIGCWSYIGKTGGQQFISIGNGCDTGTVIHEIAHAIGIYHEQSRSDRDEYITIIEENISEDHIYNFEKNQQKIDLYYDFDSIMHYNQWAFSKNGKKTIELKNPTDACFIGQNDRLSYHDIILINELFGKPGQPKDNDNNIIYLCGGRNFKTHSFFFTQYQKIGNKYQSKWAFKNEYKFIKFNKSKQQWELTYKNNLYGYAKTLNSTWNLYNINTKQFENDSSSYLDNLNSENIIINEIEPNYILTILFIIIILLTFCCLCCCLCYYYN